MNLSQVNILQNLLHKLLVIGSPIFRSALYILLGIILVRAVVFANNKIYPFRSTQFPDVHTFINVAEDQLPR